MSEPTPAEAGPAGAREDVCREYQSSLEDLTFNSKPYINMLTILAEENLPFAKEIVSLIEAQAAKAPSSEKLPVMYLMDSIVKNVGREYLTAFTKNLVATFICVFEKVDENTRKSLFKLRSTWNEIFPLKKLYALDVRVNSVDPAWPIQPLPPNVNTSSIHVNPKFLNKSPEEPSAGKIRQSGCKQSHMEDFMPPSREGRNAKRSTEQDVRDPKRIKNTEEERPQETTNQHSTKSGTEPKENVGNWSNSKSNKRWKSGWEENKSLQQGADHRESWSSTKGILSPRAPKQQHRLSVDANLQIPEELTLASKRELLQKTSECLASGEITQDEFLVAVHQIRQLFQYQEGVREEQRSPFNDRFPLKRPRCEDADKPFVDSPASRLASLDTNQRLTALAEDRPLFDGPSRPSVTRDGPTKMIFEGPNELSPRIDGPPAPGSLRFDGSPGQMGEGGPLRFERPQGLMGSQVSHHSYQDLMDYMVNQVLDLKELVNQAHRDLMDHLDSGFNQDLMVFLKDLMVRNTSKHQGLIFLLVFKAHDLTIILHKGLNPFLSVRLAHIMSHLAILLMPHPKDCNSKDTNKYLTHLKDPILMDHMALGTRVSQILLAELLDTILMKRIFKVLNLETLAIYLLL
uniref:Pre-mRNA cleavage complex 2 protein Pcf11 n=1 Tax=Myotis myotis TaxID=51298 RepID=A0A7J7WI80_MYOMY|nr:hypothetical protein mMyoMyo1_012127 [Myotis myotis]